MKRIIDGATYNTDTATAVATGVAEDEQSRVESTLYQSRSGLYFNVDEVTAWRRVRGGETKEVVSFDWEVVGDAASGRTWAEKYEMTILRDIDDMPPEAMPGEKMATVYLRVTPTLKSDLDGAAADDKVSGNLWATRCLERCLSNRDGRDLVELAEISVIAGCFLHGDEGQDRDLCVEALQRIAHLVDPLARKIVGVDDALTALMGFGDALEIEEARRRFGASDRG